MSPPASAKVTVPALPVIVVWSPVFVPEDEPEKFEPESAPVKAPVVPMTAPKFAFVENRAVAVSPVDDALPRVVWPVTSSCVAVVVANVEVPVTPRVPESDVFPLNILLPANVWVVVETNPRATDPAFGILNV